MFIYVRQPVCTPIVHLLVPKGEAAVCSSDCLHLRAQPDAPYAHEGFQNRNIMTQKKRHAAKEKRKKMKKIKLRKSSRGENPISPETKLKLSTLWSWTTCLSYSISTWWGSHSVWSSHNLISSKVRQCFQPSRPLFYIIGSTWPATAYCASSLTQLSHLQHSVSFMLKNHQREREKEEKKKQGERGGPIFLNIQHISIGRTDNSAVHWMQLWKRGEKTQKSETISNFWLP